MKTFFQVFLGIWVVLSASGCSRVAPGPGQAAVLVAKPWFFGHGGVLSEPVTTGLSFTALSTTAYYVSMVPMQYNAPFDDLMTSDGVPLSFHAGIRLQVVDPVQLVAKFGPHWYENNVAQEFANRVRSAVKKHGMNETAIQPTAIEAIDTEVTGAMDKYIKEAGLPIRLMMVTVGKANPPDAVRDQRVATAQEEQRVLTEQKRNLAEQARKAAEDSRAQADNAYRMAMDLTPEQFVQLERIKMEAKVCAHDKSPCTFILGASVPAVVGAR